jgi:hypothetical protein
MLLLLAVVGVVSVRGVVRQQQQQQASAQGSYIHISDMHLDLFSEPSKYSPAQFCRNPKFMPHAAAGSSSSSDDDDVAGRSLSERAQRQWQSLVDLGVAKHDRSFSAAHRGDASALNAALNAQLPPAPFGWQLCDSKPVMVDGLLADAAAFTASDAPDFLVMTGDWAAHLQLSLNSTITAVQTGARLLDKYFPNTLIVPSVGNNDVDPDYNVTCDMDDYVGMYLQWHQWIDDSQTANFLHFGGFESRLHQDKLRIFSLNSVLYSARAKNFEKDADPCGQLAWLAAGLASARADKARAIVIGHIPPKSIVTSPSQAAFYYWPLHQHSMLALLHQYHDVISMTLWGHSHRAEQWSDQQTSPAGLTTTVGGLMAPAITPLPSYPSYRVGTYDLQSFDFLDFTQRYLNLQQANINDAISVQTLYTYSEAYGLPDLKMTTLRDLRELLLSNHTLGERFLQYYFSGYEGSLWETVCSLDASFENYWKCRFSH